MSSAYHQDPQGAMEEALAEHEDRARAEGRSSNPQPELEVGPSREIRMDALLGMADILAADLAWLRDLERRLAMIEVAWPGLAAMGARERAQRLEPDVRYLLDHLHRLLDQTSRELE